MDAVSSSHTQKDSGKQPGGVNGGAEGVGVGGRTVTHGSIHSKVALGCGSF